MRWRVPIIRRRCVSILRKVCIYFVNKPNKKGVVRTAPSAHSYTRRILHYRFVNFSWEVTAISRGVTTRTISPITSASTTSETVNARKPRASSLTSRSRAKQRGHSGLKKTSNTSMKCKRIEYQFYQTNDREWQPWGKCSWPTSARRIKRSGSYLWLSWLALQVAWYNHLDWRRRVRRRVCPPISRSAPRNRHCDRSIRSHPSVISSWNRRGSCVLTEKRSSRNRWSSVTKSSCSKSKIWTKNGPWVSSKCAVNLIYLCSLPPNWARWSFEFKIQNLKKKIEIYIFYIC